MTASAPATADGASGGAAACSHCGAAVEPLQEYCLECGRRVVAEQPPRGVTAAWRDRVRTGDWTLPVLVAGIVAAAATAAALVAAQEEEATGDQLLVATAPIPEDVPVTPVTAPEPATTAQTTTSAPPPRRVPRSAPIEWPEQRNGYTVVLASIRNTQGRAAAMQRAREALAAGLDNVGVLRSDDFASLADGFYVVFTGVHSSLPAAERATGTARRAGYEDAYAAPVTR